MNTTHRTCAIVTDANSPPVESVREPQAPLHPDGQDPLGEINDERLMLMIQAHCTQGLALLHQRYARLLTGLSMTVLHNSADADDLIQEVFMEIWERAAGYDPLKGRALSWIATMTRRRSIDRLRRRDTCVRIEERFAEEHFDQGDGWAHVHQEVADAERSACLNKAIATLPESQQTAIHLAYREGLTQRQIAGQTGVPLGTIKTRLDLGLRKLAASLTGLEDLLWVENRASHSRIRRDAIRPDACPSR